jgi:hypothetical protein
MGTAHCGRRPKLDSKAVSQALKSVLYEQTKFKNLALKTNVHRTTLMRAVKKKAAEQGTPIFFDWRKPKQELTTTNKQQRVAFAKANLRRDWDKVMFTDRKRFYFLYPGTAVSPCWCIRGTRRKAFKPSAPSCFNVYLGISPRGVTACHAVSGTTNKKGPKYYTQKGALARNITSQEYYYVLMKTLLPEGQRLFKGAPWILQQDGDRSHSVASKSAVDAYNKLYPKNHINILPQWPANSPDLSPIENLWAVVQAKADAMGCKTFTEYQNCVVTLIQKTPLSHLSNYYKSMKGRLNKCIDKGGSRIDY